MKQKLTKQEILNLNPCHNGLRFALSCDFDPVKIWNTCERGDWLIWMLRNTGNLPKPVAVKLAIACADHVLDKFELKYPNDKRPRAAIKAAKKWLAEPTEENRISADAAAAAAHAAAAAAYATAAVAAHAAAAAAYAAAAAAAHAAAAAAYAAAAAAAAAAHAARLNEHQWQADKIREIIKCPFTK